MFLKIFLKFIFQIFEKKMKFYYKFFVFLILLLKIIHLDLKLYYIYKLSKFLKNKQNFNQIHFF